VGYFTIHQDETPRGLAAVVEVTPFRRGGKDGGPRDPDNLQWLRWQAVQTVAQLPQTHEDALLVLKLAVDLVRYINGDLSPD
jgi:hypothetical protein